MMRKEVIFLIVFYFILLFILGCTSENMDSDQVISDRLIDEAENILGNASDDMSLKDEIEGQEIEEREKDNWVDDNLENNGVFPNNVEIIDDEEIRERHWERVFTKAFAEIDCPQPRDPQSLPDGYYKGPMIDAHVHLQSLPDGEPGLLEEEYTGSNIGIARSMAEWICMMNIEGTTSAIGFFPVWEPIISESLDLVQKTMDKYPGRFIPFIMPPDDDGNSDGFPTVDAKEFKEMLAVYPGLFQGYGEIGLYERPGGALDLPPNSERLKEIYHVIREHSLVIYFHLGEGQKEALEEAASENPDIQFIFHGDQLIDCAQCDGSSRQVAEILERHPNVYYGIDELYGDVWLLKPGSKKEDFFKHFNDYGPILKKDIDTWKDFIEKHPDQVLFGTDRGVSVPWDTDPDVALTLNNYTRAFIGKLDSSVQEKFAYKNADKLFR
ncbi:amidohydrolase family protein [Candidatus Woesearchaeota archaeon]|nr:amidohydrolase family protein [Candidatus Woesearchaeota archaeon]